MAIEFYSSIDLNNNELQNAIVQNVTSDPSGGNVAEGQIVYRSDTNELKVHTGSGFVALSTTTGDITGVTAGNGLTGGGTSGGVTLTVGAGDGITVNSGDVAVTADLTTVTSVVNSSLEIGRDADNRIKFGTDNQIIFEVSGGDNVIFKASGEIEASSLDISGDVDVDGTLETDALSIASTTVTSTAAELNLLDGSTAGTVIASKAVVVDSNKDIGEFRNITLTGELDAGSLDVSGNADIDGTLEADAITIGDTNILTGGIITSLGTIAQDSVLFQSGAANDPILTIENTRNDVNGARLKFLKDKGAAGADNDEVGEIIFSGDNDAQQEVQFASIVATINDASDGAEEGKLVLNVASHDGESQPGITIVSGDAEDEVDVTIGNGANSVVTIPGDLTVVGTQTVNNVVTVSTSNGVQFEGTAADGNDASDGAEEGKLVLNVASHDGESQPGITIVSGDAEDEVDVTIGNGANSVVTIPGNLTVTGTQTVNNVVTVSTSNGVQFEGTAADGNDAILKSAVASSDKTYTLPNITGHIPILTNDPGTTAVSATVAELNILDGVTSTATELNLLDGSEGGTITNNKAVIYDGNGVVNATTLQIGGSAITATVTEINKLDGVTASTDELNIMDGVTATTSELNIMDGVTATTSELNIMDGVTATTAEINLIDGGTARGTTAVEDGDGILTNDGGTMRMTKVETFATYFGAEIASQRQVVADIDVSSLTDDLRATITHDLGTADVMVQLYDKTTEATVYADIGRTTDDFSTASTSVITVDFGTTPPNDIRCVITSLKGASTGSVAYT